MNKKTELLNLVMDTSIKAGKAILDVYHTDFEVDYKKDASPLTLADRKAHEIITKALSKTDIPILSEEGRNIPYEERKNWKRLWIVDPLDGTKEFVKRNDEFTVNIALVENGTPVLGVVYAPVLDEIYFGEKETGAFKIKKASVCKNMMNELTPDNRLPLAINLNKDYYGIVASRSHLTPETTAFINKVKKEHDLVKTVSKGSSLKICMVAEGTADIYPRFAPTSEWDTAAGHAVVLASGGRIVQANKPGDEVIYNKEDVLNPWFIVSR